ncbi:MAG: YggS family pyridoxal phosphate-dependent enzyme [Burkholderiales bacterium]
MTPISANWQAVRARIANAARAAGRPAQSVALLAVSKTFGAAQVRECYSTGQRAFGENYVQEALDKIAALADSPDNDEIEWHMIGPIQSNKTRAIAEHFQWVHSVERDKIAQRLNESRPAYLPPLNICIQVNVSGEASKSGLDPGAEVALAALIANLPRLRLRGLMSIPEPTPDTALQRQRFARLRHLQENLIACGHTLDTLSMGMSDDLEAAIAEGATMVRVGTAIFGRRT